MAFAVVQAIGQTTGTGSTVNVTVASTTVRNLICVHIGMDTGETCTGVTDSAGNTYTLKTVVDSGVQRIYFAYSATTIGGVTTVTPAFSGSVVSKNIRVEEYSGAVAGQVFVEDVTNTGTGTGAAVAITTFTPNVAGELIVASYKHAGTVNWVAGVNYTQNGSGAVLTMSQYDLAGTTSETAPATHDGGGAWAGRAIAFKTAIVGSDTSSSTDSQLMGYGIFPTDTSSSTDSVSTTGWASPAKGANGNWTPSIK